MVRTLRRGLRASLLLPALALVLLTLAGCDGGDAPPTPQKPYGSLCTADNECTQGLCLALSERSEKRCVPRCTQEGVTCSTGGRCIFYEVAKELACSPPISCSGNPDCGTNATCVTQGELPSRCQCATNFHGDPAKDCGACTLENARKGCTRQALSLPELKGRCQSLEGDTVAGPCVRLEDCPDPTRFSCLGYQPAVVADPPCACADLRDLDLSGGSDLRGLAGAWYNAATKWPKDFDPTRSGALGPGAKLAGIDLAGRGLLSVERTVVGGEQLTSNTLRHGRVVSGSVELKLGGAVLDDKAQHGVLVGAGPYGLIDYAPGVVTVEGGPAPSPATPAEVAYRYRVQGVPLRSIATVNTSVSQATTFEPVGTGGPVMPRSATVRIMPEPLVPDAPLDGRRQGFSFSGDHALSMAPLAPGTLRVLAGPVELEDKGRNGRLEASDGSTGTIDYTTGKLTLKLARPLGETETLAAHYEAVRTDGPFKPDFPFNGQRKRVTFTRERALRLKPLLPGRLMLRVGRVTFTELKGRLTGSDGSSGRLDLETGELVVDLVTAPPANTEVHATYYSKGAMTLTDRAGPRLTNGKGTQGAVDYVTAQVHVDSPARLHSSTQAFLDFERHAERTLATTPELDGGARSVQVKLGPGPIGRGSVRIQGGPEVLTPRPAFNGAAKTFSLSLARRPVAPGTLALEVGGVRLTDVSGQGVLSGSDDSGKGTLNYQTGELTLELSEPPLSSEKATASYAQQRKDEGLVPDLPPDGSRRELTFTGKRAAPAPMRPGSAVVTVSEGLVPAPAYDGLRRQQGYQLGQTPVALGSVELRVGSVVFTDAARPGTLEAADKSTGTIDPVTGVVKLEMTTAPAVTTRASAEYGVVSADSLERVLTPDVAFDGAKLDHTFSGANALGPGVLPGSLHVTFEAVPLVPDSTYDGLRTNHSYTYSDKVLEVPALRPPVVPGSVEVRVGSTTLRDARSTGELTSSDGSSGTLNYATGVLTAEFSRAPPNGATSTVVYRTQTTDAPLTPDPAFDGRQTRFVFKDTNALGPTPLVPGSVTVLIGSLLLTETTPGVLTGPGGNGGTIDHDTGLLMLVLPLAPTAGSSVQASYQTQAAVVLRDRKTSGLTGDLLEETGSDRGDVQYATGLLDITLAAAPAPGTVARASFSRRETLVPSSPFNGSARAHDFKLAKTPVRRGSVSLTIGATTLAESTKGSGMLSGQDGSTGTIDYLTGKVTVAMSTATQKNAQAFADYGRDAALVFTESSMPGTLHATDGSNGQVVAQTGVMRLSLRQPLAPGAQVRLARDVPAEILIGDDSNGALTGDNVSGSLDYLKGEANLDFTQAPPPGTGLSVTYTQAGELVERTDLEGIALSDADLKSANLAYTNLRDANLANADLTGADLTGADLTGANLRGANLTGATLQGARLEGTNLLGANLSGVDLSGASGIDPSRLSMPGWYEAGLTDCKEISVPGCVSGNYYPEQLVQSLLAGRIDPRKEGLEGAMLEGADLSGLGDLTGARLRGANLRGANLRGLRMAGADLTDAMLDGAILTEVQAPDTVCPNTQSPCYDGGRACRGTTQACMPKAGAGLKLTQASLVKAQLDHAVLTGAEASKAVMTQTNLSGTDASRAKLTSAQLDSTLTDTATRLAGADLTQASLVGADLRGMVLDGAKLNNANLTRIIADENTRAEGATFSAVNLTEACLTNASLLRGAKLDGAIAQRASLAGADLQGTDFSKVDLTGATLASDGAGAGDPCHCTPERGPVTCGFTRAQGALFKDATLAGVNFNATDLREVALDKADLRQARLVGTDLRQATLSGANLSGTDLRKAVLSGAKLVGTNLSRADLSGNELIAPLFTGADLSGADLRRTVMQGANFSGALLDGVLTDSTTALRGANLALSTIRGCIRADLSDAVLTNASLLQAAFITPTNQSYDAAKDFNCRMDFEGALLSSTANTQCGTQAVFPAAGSWVEAGRSVTGVYSKARLLTKVETVRKKLDCAVLPDVDLRGRDLSGASLRGAQLNKSRLGRDDQGQLANLSKAQLQGAQLTATSLEWAQLSGADFTGAVLTGASLQSADLRGAVLSKVVLDSTTNLQYAKYSCPGQTAPGCTVFPDYPTFRWRQLGMIGPQSDLSGMDLSGYPGLSNPPVDLSGANLKDTKFNWSNVSGVNFSGANLETGGFSHANVSGANFSNANLKSANFSSASLGSGTNFGGANLMEANFAASSGTPAIGSSLCNDKTAFNSASAAYVFLLDISIKGSFPLYFPVITLEFVPGWKVNGQCCFPVYGGIRIGC